MTLVGFHITILCDVISFSVICKLCIGGARHSCCTGVCIVVLGLDVLSNGLLCTGYLGALSCVLFALCCVLLKCAYCCVYFRCRSAV